MRVRLTPLTPGASGPRTFEVKAAAFDTTKGELTLTCRDGRICLGLQGTWQMEVCDSFVRLMSTEEAEREHDGRSLLVLH
jgi:hypothetical protein